MIVDQKANKNIVGVYLLEGTIDGAKIGLATTPNKVRRAFAKMYLGWEWISIEKLKILEKENGS